MSEPGPTLIIIAGPNGAGKSTLAPFLLRDTLGLMEYVNADTVALGLSAFQPETVAMEAGRIMLKRLRDLARQRADFAFETTLASRSYASWLRRLRQEGYNLHLLFLWLRSPDMAIERVKERVRVGGHNIPEAVICRRYHRGIRNFFNLYQSLVDTWVVYDNSTSSEAARIVEGTGSNVKQIYQPDWWTRFCEAKDDRQA
jgi:predicted ABC-type ATPase